MEEHEIAQREAQLAQREQTLAARIIRFELAQHLAEAKCRPEAIADAAALMATAASSIELGPEGLSIAKVTLGSEASGPAAAARAFIKARPFLQGSTDAPGAAPRTTINDTTRALAALAPTPAQTPTPRAALRGSALELIEKGYSPEDLANEGFATDPA